MTRYDLAIVGSGYAGSLTAMIARRLGLSVLLLDRGTHPRIVIGESSTPLSNLLLETLADRYDLPFLKPLTKWGTWQQTYPEIACGLKRGFSFYHHASHDTSPQQLLVAASPNDTIADTHWFRADFDQFLVRQAQQLGVEFFEGASSLTAMHDSDGWTLGSDIKGRQHQWQADFIIDATGPRGFLHHTLQLKEQPLPGLPHTSALYAHFSGVDRFASLSATAPYPPDDAALHHVFDGGWIWILRFNNGLTSAGVVATQPVVARFGLHEKEGWSRLLDSLPHVKQQFANAVAEAPFTFTPQVTFRSASVAGKDWALLPSAAGFVDPMLSTGFPLTLLGIERIAELLREKVSRPKALAHYAEITDRELNATASLLAALYANFNDFDLFRALTLLYFAAASFSETARRLHKSHLADSFLLTDHPVFGPAARRITTRAQQYLSSNEKQAFAEEIYSLIEDFDVAGLSKRPADHTYPVLAEDLFAGAHKLGATRTDMESLLERTGFFNAVSA